MRARRFSTARERQMRARRSVRIAFPFLACLAPPCDRARVRRWPNERENRESDSAHAGARSPRRRFRDRTEIEKSREEGEKRRRRTLGTNPLRAVSVAAGLVPPFRAPSRASYGTAPHRRAPSRAERRNCQKVSVSPLLLRPAARRRRCASIRVVPRRSDAGFFSFALACRRGMPSQSFLLARSPPRRRVQR